MHPIDPTPAAETGAVLRLRTTGVAVGGEAVARHDGRVVFVEGALADEEVDAALTEEKSRFARARLVDVVTPAPGRIEPVCPEWARGCGGCDLPFADAATQSAAKAQMVQDALARVGRLADVPAIGPGPELARSGFRTTIRAAVVDGRAGLRRRGSHDVVDVASCRVSHPLVEELLVDGRYGDAREVTIRVGAATGHRMVHVDGDPGTVRVPDGVVVVGPHGPADDAPASIDEVVAGRTFRISAGSFFQTRRDGAEALVAAVASALPDADASTRTLVDLGCGVGLFAGTIPAGRVVAVESHRGAVADARHNLADLGDAVRVIRSTFDRWRSSPADVVVADPPRAGLGRRGVEAVVATGAGAVVLVSCDAGSLGRDAGLLVQRGYRLASVTLVDMFPDTSHVEVVSSFVRVP